VDVMLKKFELIPEADDGAHECEEEKRVRGHNEEERVFPEFKELGHYVKDETNDEGIFDEKD
jgi:hypothetical protein